MKQILAYFSLRQLVSSCLLLVTVATNAQVTVNLQVNPPYSPFFRDYQGYDINKIYVMLLSTSNREVYLTSTITNSDGSISVSARPDFKPSTSLQLFANQPRNLTGSQLNTIYGESTSNDLVVIGMSKEEMLQQQALPEGVYTICIEVKDYQTGTVLGTSCRSINIFYFEPPQFIQPICGSTIKETKPQNLLVSWNPVSPGASNLTYKLKVCKYIEGMNELDIINNNIQVILDRSNIRTTFFQLGDLSGIKLDPGQRYIMEVTASASNAYFKNNGRSLFCSFIYTKDNTIVTTDPNTPNSDGLLPTQSSVSGKLVYRYKKSGELPKNSSFSIISTSQAGALGSTFGVKQMPDVVGAQRFDQDNASLPIKNTQIYLYYDLVISSKPIPSNWDDFTEILNDEAFQGSSSKSIVEPNGMVIYDNYLVASTKTNSDGSFTFPAFINDLKLGFIGTRDIEFLVKKPNKYGQMVYSTESEPYQNIYGVLHIVIDNHSYYCHPDLMLFPKPGQAINLLPEVCFVDSRNIEVKVQTDASIKDQIGGSGKAMAGYPVQIGRNNSYAKVAAFPYESEELNLTNLTGTSNGIKQRIINSGKTNEIGVFKVENVANAHTVLSIQAVDPGLDATKVYGFSETIPDTYKNGQINVEATEFKPTNCNTGFKAKTYNYVLNLKPKNPEIYLRAVAIQNGQTIGLEGVTVEITESFFFKKTYKTDKDGYLLIKDLSVSYDDAKSLKGPLRTIVLKYPGYTDKVIATNQTLLLGERFPANPEVIMSGSSAIYGYVKNEKGEAVACHVRVGNGPYVSNTSFGGYFYIPNCPSGLQNVEILPDVDNYFGEQTNYLIVANSNNNLKTITVKEKLHRVKFMLVDENDQPILGKVGLIDVNNGMVKVTTSSSTGISNEISFASPASEFHVKTTLNGYIPFDDYVLIPIRKYATTVKIKLTKGQTINGYVYDAVSKKPVAGARVYVVTGTNDDGEIQRETYTNSLGHYTLSNVPVPGYSLQSSMSYDWITHKPKTIMSYVSNKLKVYAVKSGSPAYVQGIQNYPTNSTGNVDFNLTPINGLAEIWGNPIEVTSVNKNVISGAFVSLKTNDNFGPLLSNARLPFKSIELNQTQLMQGKIVPLANEITTEATSLKIKINGAFEGEALGTDVDRSIAKLKITNNITTKIATLNAFVVTTLSSFDFSYNYTGGFFLKTPGIRIPGKNNTIPPAQIKVLATTTNSGINYSKYDLLPRGTGKFKVHNFDASIGSNSYLMKDTFTISADILTQIKLMENQKLDVGDIKITNNSIQWLDSKNAMGLNIEKWKISGTGLKYDLNKGGFIILNPTLQTNLPSLALQEVVLRPQTIDLGSNSISNVSLSLAGVTPLNLYPNTVLSLVYDASAPFDHKEHWRLNMTNSSAPVAYINHIPGIASMDKINIQLFTAYSDGEHQTVNINPVSHNYFNVITQKIAAIEIGKTYFTLIGNTDLKIPGAGSSITGRFRYYKAPNSVDIISEVESFNTDVELPGKVQFNGRQLASDYHLVQDTLWVKGDIYVYQSSKLDGFKIQGTLLKTPSLTSLTFKKDELIKLDMNNSDGLKVVSGGSIVNSTTKQWNNVLMTNQIVGFGNTTKSGQDIMQFEIKGGIENINASKNEVGFSGVDTPFGGLKICYDFKEHIMKGSLSVNVPIPAGPVVLNEGTIDVQMGKGGFVMAGAFHKVTFTPIVMLDGLQASIAIGYFSGPLPDYMQKNLLSNTLYNQLPDKLTTSGLHGFYANVGKLYQTSFGAQGILPDEIAEHLPSVKAALGFDIRTLMDFNNGATISVSALVKGSVSVGFDLISCEIGASGNGEGIVDFTYTSGTLKGTGQIEISLLPKFCTTLPGLTLGANASCDTNKNINFSFYKK